MTPRLGKDQLSNTHLMLLGLVLMPIFILYYDVPKLLDVVLLKVDSFLHGIMHVVLEPMYVSS